MIFDSSDFFPTIETAILSGVRTFRTKKDAIMRGSEYGWKTAIQVRRRFETVWMVGLLDFQNSYEKDIQFEQLRLPLLTWETNSCGIKFNPILKLRRPKTDPEVQK